MKACTGSLRWAACVGREFGRRNSGCHGFGTCGPVVRHHHSFKLLHDFRGGSFAMLWPGVSRTVLRGLPSFGSSVCFRVGVLRGVSVATASMQTRCLRGQPRRVRCTKRWQKATAAALTARVACGWLARAFHLPTHADLQGHHLHQHLPMHLGIVLVKH